MLHLSHSHILGTFFNVYHTHIHNPAFIGHIQKYKIIISKDWLANKHIGLRPERYCETLKQVNTSQPTPFHCALSEDVTQASNGNNRKMAIQRPGS